VAVTREPDRLPRPPRRHRPGLAALAVLLIVLGGALAGLLALRIDHRVPVLVARHEIAVGEQIGRDDLAVARIATEGVATIPAVRTGTVLGRYAAVRITSGRLIDDAMLSSTGLLTSGRAAVGVSLAPGRYPASGLSSGDVVQVIRAQDGAATVISDRATVGSVRSPSENVFGDTGTEDLVVTVVLPRSAAPDVAAAAAADQVSLVLLSRGEPLGSS
jgi:hypothetical protein